MPVWDILTVAPGVGSSYGAAPTAIQSWDFNNLPANVTRVGSVFKGTQHQSIYAIDLSTIPAGSTINTAVFHTRNKNVFAINQIWDFYFLGPAPSHAFDTDQTIFGHMHSRADVTVNGVLIHSAPSGTYNQIGYSPTVSLEEFGVGFVAAGSATLTSGALSEMLRNGTATGNVWLTLHPVTTASNGEHVCGDTVLATSDTRAFSTITTGFSTETFTFSDGYSLVAGTHYAFMVHTDIPDSGDASSNTLRWRFREIDNSGPFPNTVYGRVGTTPAEAGILAAGGASQPWIDWVNELGGTVVNLVTGNTVNAGILDSEMNFGDGLGAPGGDIDFVPSVQAALDADRLLVFAIEANTTAQQVQLASSNHGTTAHRPFIRIDFTAPVPAPVVPPAADPGDGAPGATPSETSVANAALVCLGEKRITSLDANTKTARVLKERFTEVRDEALRAHPWTFAKQRVSLAADSQAPAWGFARQFTLPSDCLRLLEVDADESRYPWRVEGRKIVTSIADPLEILYLRRITNPREMDSLFRQYWAVRLAFDVCEAITGDSDKLLQVFDKMKAVEILARAANGQEDVPPDELPGTFERARGREDKSR